MSSRKRHAGLFKRGNTLASRGAKTRGPNITITHKKNKGKQPANADAVAALLASTYRNIKEPCPECGATQIQATDGNRNKKYWCVNKLCAYIKPKGKGIPLGR